MHSAGDPGLLRYAAELAAAGALRVLLDDVLPLERIEDAFVLLTTGPLGTVGLSLP